MKKILALFLLILVFSPGLLMAQNSQPDLHEINQKRISLNSNAMMVLGGWAVTNITVGSVGMNQTSGTTKYFHEMNAAWNTVNLAIAGLGYYGLRNQSPDIGLSETISEFHSLEKILLFNAGLNVGYIATGAYLWERGLRKEQDRLIGYGQSMILQGGFLLLFDSTLYLLSRRQSSRLVDSLNSVQFTGNALRVSKNF